MVEHDSEDGGSNNEDNEDQGGNDDNDDRSKMRMPVGSSRLGNKCSCYTLWG